MRRSAVVAVVLLTLMTVAATAVTAAPPRAGELDRTFNPPRGYVTAVPSGDADGLIPQPGGKIVAVGDAAFDPVMVRYLRDGSIDPSFGIDGTGVSVTPIAGLAVVGAAFTQGNGVGNADIITVGAAESDVFVLRHDKDGRLDRSFGTDGRSRLTIGENPEANDGAVQADGKIIVVGGVGSQFDPNNPQTAFIARFDRDGGADTSFGDGGVVSLDVLDGAIAFGVAVQDDGRIVVVGSATQPEEEGGTELLAARLLPDGSLDPSFGEGGVVLLEVGETAIGYDVVIDRDGRILVSGTGNADDTDGWLLARFLPDGTLDPSFGATAGYVVATPLLPNEVFGQARSVHVQPDGRIVAAGVFGPNIATTRFYVGRFLSDGTLDSSFGVDGFTGTTIGSFSEASTAALLPDGKIVLGGQTVLDDGTLELTVARYLGHGPPHRPRGHAGR